MVPREEVSPLSRLTHWWMTRYSKIKTKRFIIEMKKSHNKLSFLSIRVMVEASKREITDIDLYNPDQDQLAESESAKLERVWQPLANE